MKILQAMSAQATARRIQGFKKKLISELSRIRDKNTSKRARDHVENVIDVIRTTENWDANSNETAEKHVLDCVNRATDAAKENTVLEHIDNSKLHQTLTDVINDEYEQYCKRRTP